MTLLAWGPNFIMCGSTGYLNRGCRDRPLPKGLGHWANKRLTACPTDVLERYRTWMAGPDADWHEMWEVEDILEKRNHAASPEMVIELAFFEAAWDEVFMP
jgi:hypothetical protein